MLVMALIIYRIKVYAVVLYCSILFCVYSIIPHGRVYYVCLFKVYKVCCSKPATSICEKKLLFAENYYIK